MQWYSCARYKAPGPLVFCINNRNSSCIYTVGRHERSSDYLDTVLSVFEFIMNIGCLIQSLKWKSSMAQWWEHWPLESEFVSSNPALYIFLRIKLLFFLYLSFFIFLNFEVKQCANIYWKNDITGFAMEKKPSFFLFFKEAYTPHKGTIRPITHVPSFLYSIYYAFLEMKWSCTWWPTLYTREKEHFVFLKNDNSSCLWYTSGYNWKSSFVLLYNKNEDGYPQFSFFDNIVN